MTKCTLLGMAGLGIGLAFATGCMTRGSGSFSGTGVAEPDLTPPSMAENPMPASLSPVQPGNVRYPDPRPAKTPEYWQQHSDPYAGIARPVAPAIKRPVATSTASSGQYYTVKSGDILGRIAREHGVKVSELKAANGLVSDKINVGQKLRIPAKSTASAKPAASTAAPGYYIVKKGDILGRIARQHGVKVAALKAANNLTSDKITVGQKLRIPGIAVPAPKATPAATTAKATETATPARSSTEVRSAVTDVPATPAVPVIEIPEVPAIDTTLPPPTIQGATPPAPQETFVYYANGNEDIYTIAISHTVNISDAKRLNPQLADEFERATPRKLPAGTPVTLTRK